MKYGIATYFTTFAQGKLKIKTEQVDSLVKGMQLADNDVIKSYLGCGLDDVLRLVILDEVGNVIYERHSIEVVDETPTTTLKELRTNLVVRVNTKEAIECPVCKKAVREYKTNIKSVVKHLVSLRNAVNGKVDEFIHRDDFIKEAGGNFSKLTRWGLITDNSHVKAVEDDESMWSSGGIKWGITALGLNFLANKIAIPTYAHTLNDEVMSYSGERVFYKDLK